MEEKRTMYSVVGSAFPASSRRLCWLAWSAIAVSGVSVIISCAALIVVVQQATQIKDLVTKLETTDNILVILETRLDNAINGHDYYNYPDYPDYNSGSERMNYDYGEYTDVPEEYKKEQGDSGMYEELTFREVVRKKRDAEPDSPVPIYEQAYGVDLVKPFQKHIKTEGLRLYKHLLEQKAQGKSTLAELPLRNLNNLDPILPHHRVSSAWPSKKHNGHPGAANNHYNSPYLRVQDHDGEEGPGDGGNRQHTRRRAPTLERASRLQLARNIKFNSGQKNLVVPPEPMRVEQVAQNGDSSSIKNANINRYTPPVKRVYTKDKKHLKRPVKKQSRRRRRNTSGITVAHFVAQPDNLHTGLVSHQWGPATWMDKLGLNRKYHMKSNSVVVREPGLYYIYAQVLGKHNSLGYQVLVDGLPVLECSNVHVDRADSCHTSGLSYMPRNAIVSIRDLELGNHLTNNQLFGPRPRHETSENSFFGMVKLMDAPDTSEQLVIG